jgi:hypothetical protein
VLIDPKPLPPALGVDPDLLRPVGTGVHCWGAVLLHWYSWILVPLDVPESESSRHFPSAEKEALAPEE